MLITTRHEHKYIEQRKVHFMLQVQVTVELFTDFKELSKGVHHRVKNVNYIMI